MCGIIGYKGEKNAIEIIINGLKKLEYRGYDSAGIAYIDKQKIQKIRVRGKIENLKEEARKTEISTKVAIGHTRWATHGSPSQINAHPHSDCKNKIGIVHNGIIENYIELKKELKSKKHKFLSDTDTEVIVHLLEENRKNYPVFDAIIRTVNRLKGSFALVILFADFPELMVGIRKNSPLIFAENGEEFFFSSDILGISEFIDRAYFLEEETIVFLNKKNFNFYNFKGAEKTLFSKKIEKNSFFIEKKGFKHFMLKEIFEQPEALRESIRERYSIEKGEIFFEFDEKLINNIKNIEIISCGTSYHAGLIGEIFFQTLSKTNAKTNYASEFIYRDIFPEKNKLYIAISQSGETADTLKAVQKIKNAGYPVLAITNVSESRITRESDGYILTRSGPEISVAATKTFTSQLSVLFLLSLQMAIKNSVITKQRIIKILNSLQRLPVQMEQVLNQHPKIEEISKQYYQKDNILYLGRWINFPIALEGALKLKEISYIHAEGYPAGEMKHGPISLIEDGTPVITIAPEDKVLTKILSNIEEARSRGAEILSIGNKNNGELIAKSSKLFTIPETEELLSPFLTVIITQLFAYYIALRRGVDIDQPRNLAKAVTVE
jgi:glucosamine--fructose-6-phosphate aminotransferase (isomerizing)